MQRDHADITALLADWQQGNQNAVDRLIPLVEDELRKLARQYLARESAGNHLQATELVNEAYLRLVDQERTTWKNRAHFFGIAAQMMRRILMDHARARQAAKRGPDIKVSLNEQLVGRVDLDLIALDEALNELAALDERQSRIVALRYFVGLSIEETAEVLTLSTSTVKREWRMAKAWLLRYLKKRKTQPLDS
ncbi:sigma-70 family RNA polymerase sigma factor [Acanthopleuribacter pedis]|uniref:Sigma-70 family RNA polymerase sigma factor n=1 Tax=Acanthopleuribacter pedis TaxID=442870 RepID=A0A8J7U4G1_9BACT|nr:sigma-70 family RNA polymerase sigma factor [Acanthopleuribacter pedis]MBO1320612.1 sigma-70 family RNA polymerase sigma factor [Acanthopleuribacter pedis]